MRPFLSFSLLTFNERATLADAATRCARALAACGQSYELVIVNDGSADGSAEVADRLAADLPCCRVIHHPQNLGIGAGLRTAFFATRGQWATCFPADLQAEPEELPRLLDLLPGCDLLVTYRDRSTRRERWTRKTISAIDRSLVRILFGLTLRDLHWVRFFRREFLDVMRPICHSPSIDTEMVVDAVRWGAQFRETPLADCPRRSGKSRGASIANVAAAVTDLARLRWRLWWTSDPGHTLCELRQNARVA